MRYWTSVLAVALAAATPAMAQQTAEGRATADLLRTLLRFDTTNEPGDTRAQAAYLKQLFDAAGIENETILAPNGRAAHFIARLHGDGPGKPLLLAAHGDTVPVDRSGWTVDPFGAVEKDGYLWGRGALDNKGAVAAFARAMLRLKADKAHLKRDVVFLAEADEEQGQYNTTWLAQDHWDRMDAAFVLNEGGFVLSQDGKVSQVGVTYADKLSINIAIRTKGPAGHSSRPLPIEVSANGQMITALDALQHYQAPIALAPETRQYLAQLAKLSAPDAAAKIDRLLAATDPATKAAAAKEVIASDAGGWGIEGMLHNTLVVMLISSGIKPNMMPAHAEAVLNARLMPGTDVAAFIDDLRRTIDNPQIEVEIVSKLPKEQVADYYRERSAIKASTLDTDLFRAIDHSARKTWPGAAVMPMLLSASTDATPWRKRGVPVYGISPFPVVRADPGRVHGNDERVALSGIDAGSAYIYGLIREAAGR